MTVPIIERHRAAMRRTKYSRPLQTAIAKGILTFDQTFLDYGCGYGDDVRLLCEAGCEATGYDRYYFPDTEIVPADVVQLSFVLGVIEDPAERLETLETCWKLAKKSLVVANQVYHSRGKTKFNDGYLTSRNTFEWYPPQAELAQYLRQIAEPKRLGVGMFVLSK